MSPVFELNRDDDRVRELLAPLARVQPVALPRRPARRRLPGLRPVLLAGIAAIVLSGAGVAVAAGVGVLGSDPAIVGDFLNGASDVEIPLTHTGTYDWTSKPITPTGRFDAFNAGWRIEGGDAQVRSVEPRPIANPDGTYALHLSFDVESYTPGAKFVLLDSHLSEAGK